MGLQILRLPLPPDCISHFCAQVVQCVLLWNAEFLKLFVSKCCRFCCDGRSHDSVIGGKVAVDLLLESGTSFVFDHSGNIYLAPATRQISCHSHIGQI